ncbi:MAG: hypothetical protein ACMXYF_02455 [Candidatus Woesearchaeota archaeon]
MTIVCTLEHLLDRWEPTHLSDQAKVLYRENENDCRHVRVKFTTSFSPELFAMHELMDATRSQMLVEVYRASEDALSVACEIANIGKVPFPKSVGYMQAAKKRLAVAYNTRTLVTAELRTTPFIEDMDLIEYSVSFRQDQAVNTIFGKTLAPAYEFEPFIQTKADEDTTFGNTDDDSSDGGVVEFESEEELPFFPGIHQTIRGKIESPEVSLPYDGQQSPWTKQSLIYEVGFSSILFSTLQEAGFLNFNSTLLQTELKGRPVFESNKPLNMQIEWAKAYKSSRACIYNYISQFTQNGNKAQISGSVLKPNFN